MKRNLALTILLVVAVCSTAISREGKNEKALAYIKKYSYLAIQNMKDHKIPASITMAQGLLESGFGISELASKSNNHFGIKCKSHWEGDKVYHDDDESQECFRKYDCVEDSYSDHGLFLSSSSRYAHLFMLKRGDYKGWAHGLKKAGYATNPKYPTLLIGIIHNYGLDKLDDEKSEKLYSSEPIDEIKSKPVNIAVSVENIDIVASYTMNGVSVYEEGRETFVIARKGDTLRSISKKLKMREKRIVKFNKDTLLPVENDRIYLSKKRNK